MSDSDGFGNDEYLANVDVDAVVASAKRLQATTPSNKNADTIFASKEDTTLKSNAQTPQSATAVVAQNNPMHSFPFITSMDKERVSPLPSKATPAPPLLHTPRPPVNMPPPQNFLRERMRAREQGMMQGFLTKLYIDQGASKVCHPGILTLREGSNSKPRPHHFFTQDGTVSLGFCSECGISLESMRVEGMSRIALVLSFQNKDLFVKNTSTKDSSFQVIRADGSIEFLSSEHITNIHRGDKIVFGKLNYKSFAPILHILFHRAPIRPSPKNMTDNAPRNSSDPNRKEAYPKCRQNDLRRAKKDKAKVVRAHSKLNSGKKMTRTERKKMRATVNNIENKNCPFEMKYSICNHKKCPFRHKNGAPGRAYKHGEQVKAAAIITWHPDRCYAFARSQGGTDFYIHASQLKFDPRIIHVGLLVDFEACPAVKTGKADSAANVTISQG